jgi:hypothetical protein
MNVAEFGIAMASTKCGNPRQSVTVLHHVRASGLSGLKASHHQHQNQSNAPQVCLLAIHHLQEQTTLSGPAHKFLRCPRFHLTMASERCKTNGVLSWKGENPIF